MGIVSGSLRIARIAGIEIRVHVSWLLIFALVTYSLASAVLPASWSAEKQLAIAALAALLFFASIVAHELAHSLVARLAGLSVSSITLFLLGGVANLRQEPPGARVELVMAIAGPLTSFAIAGLAWGAGLAAGAALDPAYAGTVTPITDYLTTVNVVVGIFNLLPGFPLDGGRVLRAIVWAVRGERARATEIAARAGQVVAVGIGLVGGLVILIGDIGGLWYLVIAYFLYEMAGASLEQERILVAARGARVRQLMTTDVIVAREGMSVASVVDELMLPYGVEAVPVADGRTLRGLVTMRELRATPRASWPAVDVARIMRRAGDVPTADPDDDLAGVLERFETTPLVPVVRDGELVGTLSAASVTAYVRTRLTLDTGTLASGSTLPR